MIYIDRFLQRADKLHQLISWTVFSFVRFLRSFIWMLNAMGMGFINRPASVSNAHFPIFESNSVQPNIVWYFVRSAFVSVYKTKVFLTSLVGQFRNGIVQKIALIGQWIHTIEHSCRNIVLHTRNSFKEWKRQLWFSSQQWTTEEHSLGDEQKCERHIQSNEFTGSEQ